jgi:hypothetical protein
MTIRASAAALSVVAALASGCSDGGGNDGRVYLDAAGYDREYHREAATLRLPAGYGWPAKAPGIVPDMSWEPGTGQSSADTYWFCAWQREWLVSRPLVDHHRADAALAEMRHITQLEIYRVASPPPDQKYYDDLLAKAALGDPGAVSRDVQLNCPAPVRTSG